MLKDLLSKDSSERKLILFFLKLFLIWLSWKAIFFVLGEESHPMDQRMFPALSIPWEALNSLLAEFILVQSKNILELMGYTTYLNGRIIWIADANGMAMGNYCIGIQLIYYYAMLVIISPMPVLKKATGIPVGIAITFLLNIIRISGLCLVQKYIPQYVHYAHDHVFNIVVFGTLMGAYYFLSKEK